MALAYTAPTWVNGSGTGISASQLQALSDCMEGLVQGSDKAITDISMENSIITLTFADGSEETVTATGLKGISSIAKTGTVGNVDTYTITYTDGTSTTFTVTNGVTPEITITATADGQSLDNPTVTVTKTGTDAEPNYAMAFSGLKGQKGDDNNISLSVMRIGATSDPQFILKGYFYINGVLATTQAYYEIKIIDEQGIEIPMASSGTFTGDFSTVLAGSGWIPLTSIDGDTIQAYIYQDNTKAKLLACQSLVVGNKGEAGTGDMNSSVYDPQGNVANAGGIPNYVSDRYSTADTAETTLADDDKIPFYDDSASAKRSSTWSNIKAKLKSYFDGVYSAITAIGESEGATASRLFKVGEHFYKNGKFCTCIAQTAQGETWVLSGGGANYVEGTIADALKWELAETVTLTGCTNTSYFKLYKKGNEVCAKYSITLSTSLSAGGGKTIGTISNTKLRPQNGLSFFLQNMSGGKYYMGAFLRIDDDGSITVIITQDYQGTGTVLYNSGQSFYITE